MGKLDYINEIEVIISEILLSINVPIFIILIQIKHHKLNLRLKFNNMPESDRHRFLNTVYLPIPKFQCIS